MLQRAKFWKIEKELKEKKISIYELCRETNRFVNFINSIEFTDNFMEKIESIRKAETSLNTIINILFSEMNPDLNPMIETEDAKSNNYNTLILYLQKLKTSIGEARQNLTLSLKSKIDVETNVLTNNTNISFFVSQLSSVLNDLIFHTIKRASEIIIAHEREDTLLAVEFEKGKPTYYGEREILFFYLVYLYFLRTIQSSVPIFSNLKPETSSIKYLPPEAKEYLKMTTKTQTDSSQGKPEPEEKKEENVSSNDQEIRGSMGGKDEHIDELDE